MIVRKAVLGMIITCILILLSGCSQPERSLSAGSRDEAGNETGGVTGAEVQEAPEVKCYSDSDCGEPSSKEPYCFQGSVVTPRSEPVCHNKGTVKSYCTMESNDKVELCSPSREFCRDGKCLVIAEEPCDDTDNGKNYDVKGEVTDAMKNRMADKCADENTLLERYCSNGEYGEVMTEEHTCPGKCSDGICVEEE